MDPKAQRARTADIEPDARVSAIIVAHGDKRPIDLCQRSVLAETWVDELILVDAGLSLAEASRLRAFQADRRDVSLLKAPAGSTAPAARNFAAAHARGRWLLFVDPDVTLRRGAVEQLLRAGRDAPSPWVAGPRVVDTRGRERLEGRPRPPTLSSALFRAAGLKPRPLLVDHRPALVEAVSAAALLTPRADFVALGGFDEQGMEPYEAMDLCRRAITAGGEVRFAPEAEAVQYDRAPDLQPASGRSLSRFLRKSARTPLAQAAAAALSPLVHLVAGLAGLWRGRSRG
jgi:GT2 family glycosyltransferase